MTRKHYRLLGTALREAHRLLDEAQDRADSDNGPEPTPYHVWALCVVAVAAACMADNPSFDLTRFYDATGYKPE